MSNKSVLFCGKTEDKLIQDISKHIRSKEEINIEFYNPDTHSMNLSDHNRFIKDFSLIIGKVNSISTLDILFIANKNHIPTINAFNAVYTCTNRIALDTELRKIFSSYKSELRSFFLPDSWLHPSPLKDLQKFKRWTSSKLPLVFKSHLQHNNFFRFNFLAKNDQEIDDFVINYKDALYFDLYIQEFIECDGFDRKIYVVGNNVYGIKRQNPIYLYLREKPESIDVDSLRRNQIEVSKEIKNLAHILSKELKLKIFGFDLIKPINQEGYCLLDLNDFPGFKGIHNIEKVIADYILSYLK